MLNNHSYFSVQSMRATAVFRFKGGFRVLITGAHGFERTVTFAIDDDSAVIAERVRETLDE
jgi:hypothetical protein